MSGGESAIDVGDFERQPRDILDDCVVYRTVHARQIFARFAVNRDAKRMDAAAVRLDQRLARVFDPVFAAVIVAVIVRFASDSVISSLVRASTALSSAERWRIATPMRV